MAAQVRQGILTSLRQILDKRVLPSLSPLMDNPKLDKELLILVQDSFPEFCTITQNNSPPSQDGKGTVPVRRSGARNIISLPLGLKSEDFKDMDGDHMVVSGSNEVTSGGTALSISEPNEPAFSDEEDTDDIPIGKRRQLIHFHYFMNFVCFFVAAKIKMKEKAMKSTYSSSGSLPLSGPLLEISNSIADLEGNVRMYVEMLVTETDNEER